MEQTITENQEKIFNRQFERCKSELLQANCPQVFVDCVSKYFNFTKQDILGFRNKETKQDEPNYR